MNGAGDETNGLRQKKLGFRIPSQVYTGVSVEDDTDDRDEKPWQRVVYVIKKKGLHLYEPVKSVPNIFIILLLGFYCLLGFFTQLIEDDMPRVVSNADVSNDTWNKFSEESALKYLDVIIGDSPRVSGTPYHLQKTDELYALVNDIASKSRIPIVTDWQVASNDFWMELFTTPFVNYYKNVSNIIAVLEGESGFNADGTTRTSLLVNCHYDSVPFALGASDNAVFCAVLAEILNRFSKRTTKFKNNIVFLFNGAEENTLQGSHAFLDHPWAKGVTTVINLDAAGMNGKPSVFQVTDPRIMSAYRSSVSRPSAQGVGEFLFATGIIPSDTDFRIFRDFGHIQGIDIAFTKWGHVYHTRYDHPDLIKDGVIQNAGDTVLATIIAAADLDIEERLKPTPVVYVDYLNLFAITLSYPASYAVDVIVALLGLMSSLYYVWLAGPRWTTVTELLRCAVGRFCSMIAGVVLTILLALMMVAFTIQMRYLTQPWVVVPMFWIPYLVGAMGTAHWLDAQRTKSGLNRSIRALQAMAGTRLLLSLALLLLGAVPAARPLAGVLAAPLLLAAAAALASLTLLRYLRLQAWQHLVLEAVLSVPAVMFLCCLSLRLTSIMLPIMARSAADNPDYTVGLINLGMAVLMGTVVSGIELLFSRRRLWLPLGALLVGCLVVMLVPFSPYQDDGPSTQRHYWFHTEMVSHDMNGIPRDRQSGVLVTKQDPYTISRTLAVLPEAGVHLNSRTDFRNDCDLKVHCGLPLYRIPFGSQLRHSMMLYTGPPAPFSPVPRVVTNRTCAGNTCNIHLNITVTPHNVITLWPREGVNLTQWTLRPFPQPSFTLRGRPVYAILYSVATYSPRLDNLELSVTVQANSTVQTGPLLEVAHHAHKAYHPELFTDEYKALLNSVPKYFNVATFISFRNDYLV